MLREKISTDMQVSICVSATSAKSGTSGENIVMLIPQLVKVQMLKIGIQVKP